MATLRDVMAAFEELKKFESRNKDSFVKLRTPVLTAGDIERLPGIMANRQRNSAEANRLFQEIGKQICIDNGAEWGARPESLRDDASISKQAVKKLRDLTDFIRSHSYPPVD